MERPELRLGSQQQRHLFGHAVHRLLCWSAWGRAWHSHSQAVLWRQLCLRTACAAPRRHFCSIHASLGLPIHARIVPNRYNSCAGCINYAVVLSC